MKGIILPEVGTATLGDATHALGCDAGGRVTRDDDQSMGGTDRHFDWNARGLLRKAVVGDSLTDATPEAAEEYAYGPDGARHYRKSTWRESSDPNNVTFPVEHRFYLGGFEERVGGGANAPRVETTRVAGAVLHTRTTTIAEDPDDSEGAMTTQTSSISHLHRDHLGSARAVTNASGSAVAAASYDPYGGRRLDDGSRESNASELAAAAGDRTLDGARGFTGHEQLDRIGLIQLGGRVYDPRLGRFLSPDPVIGDPGRSQSWNLYSYAGNSPMSFTDPTGLAQAPLPWEDDPCGEMLGCGSFDGGGGFGATSQRIASYRHYIYAGVATYLFPSWSLGWGLEGGWRIGYNVVTVAYFFSGQTPTSVSASTPGDPEPAGRPISSAGDAAQQPGGSAVSADTMDEPQAPAKKSPPKAPPGVDIDANIREAEGRWNPWWFYDQVNTHGPWDFKQRNPAFEDFGNFHYGATGAAFGFPESILLNEAGKAQIRDENSKPGWGRPGWILIPAMEGEWPYGDDPIDQFWIKQGIDFHRNREGWHSPPQLETDR